MKKITFLGLLIMSIIGIKTWASDFTVKIASTDDYGSYIKPLKAGASIQFQISITSNHTDTCTVSLDKSVMGIPESWVSIDNNSQKLGYKENKNFLLTLSIPTNTAEGEYPFYLSFNAYDKNKINYPFSYNTQKIIVDNSPPTVPTFSIITSSTKIEVVNCSSDDYYSSTYTIQNSSAGLNGIKTYTIKLKRQDNTIVETKTINANSSSSSTFNNLISNTNYKVNVTATDVAGNTSSKEELALTAPAAPSISSSVQNFCNITLNWSAIAGAVSYKVYNVTSSIILVGETNNTNYTVTGLLAGTTYQFKVKAFNSAGSGSDDSNELTVSTLTIPIPVISGPAEVCSSDTFSVTNIPADVNLEWSQGPYISLLSSSGNSATYKATGNSQSWIKATYNAGCGIASSTRLVDAGSPKPGTISIEFDAPPRRFTASIEGMASATSYKWYLNGVLKQDNYMTSAIFQRQVGSCGYRYDVQVAMTNQCGVSQRSYTTVYEPCYNNYTVYPNPATTEINIAENDELNQLSLESVNSEPKYIKSVKIIDINGFIHYNKTYPNLTKQASIKISRLKIGNYQLIVNEGEAQESYSFIKQ